LPGPKKRHERLAVNRLAVKGGYNQDIFAECISYCFSPPDAIWQRAAEIRPFGNAGIYGFSTNAMPPQGDCFMAFMLAAADFTYRTSLYNLISGVLRSSLADLPESILLPVAIAR
jgi:hypothetical protein